MNWLSNFWGWLKVDPSRESKNMNAEIKAAGGTPMKESPSYIQQAGDMLPTIATDLEWLIVALVGLLAYVFIFKR